jgi:hypothetical protein
MSQDADKIKKLVTFKKKLETKVEELESELKEIQTMLEAVNSVLLEKGFKRAEMAKAPGAAEVPPSREELIAEPEPSQTQAQTEHENITQLKTVTGELLANLYISEGSLRVVPSEDKNFNITTSPFTHFLVERVLTKMQERDAELAKKGELTPDKILSYNIVREGDIIREITVKNVDADRLRELKSSIRWTLEKMHEKMKS